MNVRLAIPTLLACTLAACAKSEADWRSELADRDPFVRALAAIALCETAPERGADAARVLLETVDRAELGLGEISARELARVAPFAREELVAELVRDELMTLERRAAIEGALLAAGAPAAETLVAALRGGARAPALEELLVRCNASAVASLTELVEEGAPRELELLAVRALGRIGAPARPALPSLNALRTRVGASERAEIDAAIARIERSR